MKITLTIISLSIVLLIAGCSSSPNRGASKFSGVAKSGTYSVKWNVLPVMKSKVPKGLTPLMFNFSSLIPAPSNGVTQQDWEREAARSDMHVDDFKTLYGGAAYYGSDGILRSCIILAIQAGHCGRRLGLSIEQRTRMAEQILASSSQCRWVGFDPQYHQMVSYQLGAEDYFLHVPADCR